MPDEIKNPFDFGTGSIDKDQWLRDIDEGQELFIGSYGPSLNKHRTALLRQAFADLRRRISNGDMLSRTADGLYQFGSALNRDDKHMLEAYERALGFMGELARRQIKAPTKPEEKKYGTATLLQNWLRYLNPSGKFNEKAYWAEGNDLSRIAEIKKFLEQEKAGLSNFSTFDGYKDRADLEARIKAFIDNPTETNLQRLGFDNKNWIAKPVEETTETKTELELLQEALLQNETKRLNLQMRRVLSWEDYRGNPLNWNFETRPYDYQGMFNFSVKEGTIKAPSNFGAFNFGVQGVQDRLKALYNAFDEYNILKLTNFFSNLGVNYNQVAKDKTALLGAMLGLLQSSINIGDLTINPYSSLLSKYFTPMSNGAYYINGSANKEKGRYAFYAPLLIGNYSPGIHEVSYLDLPDEVVRLALEIPSQKEGGKILKMQEGGGLSGLLTDELWNMLLNNKIESKTTKPSTLAETVPQDTNEKMDFGDIVNIAGPLALDITSMLSANGVGIGTAVSAGSGLISTVWQGVNDWDSNNVWGSLGSIGANLVADGIGLIPGLGISGKVGKIAKGLAKHAKYLGLAFSAVGAHDAAQVLYKGVKNGFDLSPDEWKTLSYGLAGVAQGGAGIKRANRVNLRRGAANKKVNITYDRNGKRHISVTGKLEGLNPIGTEATRYAVTKESLIEARGATKGNRITSAPSKRFILMLQQPKDNIVLRPWETMQRPSIDLFGSKKINKTYEESLEWLKKKKAKRNSTTTTETSAEAPKETAKEKYGGILRALRNGGIIKALSGLSFPDLKPSLNFSSSYYVDWVNKNWNNPADIQASLKGYQLAGSSDRVPNGLTVKGGPDHKYDFVTKDDTGNTVYKQDFMSAYKEQLDYYDKDLGTHIFGDVLSYYNDEKKNNPDLTIESFITQYNDNVDKLRSPEWVGKKLEGTANTTTGFRVFNKLFNSMYRSYSPYSLDLEDILGESTWRRVPNTFNSDDDRKDLRTGLLEENNLKSKVIIDNDGKLKLVDQSQLPVDNKEKKKKKKEVVDTSGYKVDPMGVTTKNPFDPTLLSVAAKTLIGLRGNANIYGNLLREMPQAPLRDPIDRKLAILGWQDRIKKGQNELADLRRILQMLLGYDPQTNFAKALETERVGRDISDKSYMEDSGRQFETAGKSWNIDNEDIFYNAKVHDDNVKAILDRARMMAQIRAAWRSGDNNILMGALADTSNWWLKRYQREQDLLDKAKELALGSKEDYISNYLANKYTDHYGLLEEFLTTTDEKRKAEIRRIINSRKMEALREMSGNYASKVYDTFHNPLYGGSFHFGKIPVGKDGTKLEVEKLKARGKDNDRFVSMFKDLRKHSYRRRRR